FSSRRRHTRFSRDWSSDVCSSDLAIILDGMLPDMNSLDLVRYVRKQELQRHVPILVVSDAKAGYQMNQVLNAGADAFLGKPIARSEERRGGKQAAAASTRCRSGST